MAAPVPTRIGKYDVIGVIGRGGMGVVYQGKDPQLDRPVAIKMVTGIFADNPDMLKRFFREAQSLGSLQHPNIVTVYDLGDYGGNPYLVMEYLEGEGLDAAMCRARPLSLLEKLSIIVQVCQGLGYAHRRGVIHRDIKPANIMLGKDGGVKIFDFGIAYAGNEHVTRTGQVMGTLRYMAPEQFSGKSVDARTDIFSTGVVLYQLFTNHLPFEGENTASTMMKIVHEPPVPIGVFLSAYPPEAEQILLRALAKNPDDRYSSADELALDLSQLQAQLKEELIGREMHEVELLLERGEVYKAQSSLIRVLKIDQQHTGANRLLRELQQRIKRDEISKQVRELRERAEDAMAGEQFDKAQEYVDRALALDRNNADLQQLRETIRAAVVRAEKLHNALKMAESAHEEGKLDAAREAVEAALAVAPDDTAARTLHRLISREIEERNRQKQMEAWLAEARQQISSRKFTAAIEILKRAEELDPGAPEVQSLMEPAVAGQEQERRRRELEALIHEVDAALNSDDYRTAIEKADEGLARFPEDRNLLRLKAMADRQRQAEERRKFVDEQLAAARTLLQAGRNQELKEKLEQAIAQIGSESRLQSLLAVVIENLRREWLERLKSEALPRARRFLDDQAFDDAVQALEQLTNEIADDPEIQHLLDRARSERTHAVQDALRRAEHEPVLDLRVNILEEALRKSPQDIRLKEQLHNVRNLTEVVSKIGAEAQAMEAEHDYERAHAKWETLGTFYPQYPDLKNILKRVRGLRDRAHAEARQHWVDRIASALNACDYAQASTMLGQATQEFPVDSDLMELKEKTETALRQRAKAQKMLAEGRGLFDNQQWEPGAQIMMRACQLASQDLRIRDQAVSELALASRETIEKNWRASEFILRCLEEIRPGVAGSAEMQATIQKRRREEAINGAVEAARRKLASGDLHGSLKELEQPLGWYPDDRRLLDLKAVLDARIQQASEAARLEGERRQKEAFVVDALNRARQTADLDKRLMILEEALRSEPQESRLQQQVNAARDLRSKVASLVSDARGFEQARQYDQALARWESVAAVNRDYPDLARILDQASQRQQQARIEARVNCVRMLQLALSSAEYKRAEDLLAQAKRDFPGDRELAEIEKKVREGMAGRAEAEKNLAGAAKAVEKAKWKKALECFHEAWAAARSDPVIRGLVVSGLLAAAGAALQSDAESAEMMLAEAARVEPGSTLLGPVRAKIAEWKRAQFTEQCLGVVQRCLSAGDRETARRTLVRGLEAYPDEPRLLEARERMDSESRRREEDLHAREQREKEAREKELRDKQQREEEKRQLREQELRQREASEREAREKEQRERQQRERERLEAEQREQAREQARELEQSSRQVAPPVSAGPADVSATGIFRQAVQAMAPPTADLATRIDLPPPPVPTAPKQDPPKHVQPPAAPPPLVHPPHTPGPADVPGAKSGQTLRAAAIFSSPDRRTPSSDGDLTHIQPGIGSDELNEASLHIIERQLAAFIGPLAKVLVKRAAGRTTSVLELYTILAPSLERDADRKAFLARSAELVKSKTGSPGLTSAVPALLTTPLDVSPSSEITPAIIDQAARRLAAHLGPIAPILAKKEAKRAATVRNFYELLAERVVDPADRARFMKDSGF